MNPMTLPIATWNWLLGDDPARSGTPRMQWANLPESWGVFVLLAALGRDWIRRLLAVSS